MSQHFETNSFALKQFFVENIWTSSVYIWWVRKTQRFSNIVNYKTLLRSRSSSTL